MRFLLALLTWIVIGIVAVAGFAWSGIYPVGADHAHWPVTEHFITFARNKAIDRADAALSVPSLTDPALIAQGAQQYAKTCVACHQAPGVTEVSELRQGLYPQPPDLTRFAPTPKYAFWVIKHGLKMTGMPAWGKTHDDAQIWALVAYLRQQPTMGVEMYRELTRGADQQPAAGDAAAAAQPAG